MGRGRKKNYNSDEVLEKIMHLFWQKGYEGTSVQHIVEVSGLNRFSLYSEFGDKDQIFRSALNRYMGQLQKTFRSLESKPYSLKNIIQYFDELDMEFFRYGCFMVSTLLEKYVVDNKAYHDALRSASRFEKLVLKNIRAALKTGELKMDTDPVALTKMICALDLGIVVYTYDSGQNSDKKKIVDMLKKLLEPLRNTNP